MVKHGEGWSWKNKKSKNLANITILLLEIVSRSLFAIWTFITQICSELNLHVILASYVCVTVLGCLYSRKLSRFLLADFEWCQLLVALTVSYQPQVPEKYEFYWGFGYWHRRLVAEIGSVIHPPASCSLTPWHHEHSMRLSSIEVLHKKKQRAFAISCREVKCNIAKIHSGA